MDASSGMSRSDHSRRSNGSRRMGHTTHEVVGDAADGVVLLSPHSHPLSSRVPRHDVTPCGSILASVGDGGTRREGPVDPQIGPTTTHRTDRGRGTGHVTTEANRHLRESARYGAFSPESGDDRRSRPAMHAPTTPPPAVDPPGSDLPASPVPGAGRVEHALRGLRHGRPLADREPVGPDRQAHGRPHRRHPPLRLVPRLLPDRGSGAEAHLSGAGAVRAGPRRSRWTADHRLQVPLDARRMPRTCLRADAQLYERYVRNGFKVPTHRDPRITRVGRLLRLSSLDELPQAICILNGSMSAVGPRPVVPDELRRLYGSSPRSYLGCKPGLTGLWQVSGRSQVVYEQPSRARRRLRDRMVAGRRRAHPHPDGPGGAQRRRRQLVPHESSRPRMSSPPAERPRACGHSSPAAPASSGRISPRRSSAQGHDVRVVDCLTDYYDPAIKQANLDRLGGRRRGGAGRPAHRRPRRPCSTTSTSSSTRRASPGCACRGPKGSGPTSRATCSATQRLLEACRGRDLRRFVFASSSSVYGDAERYPTTEDDLPRARAAPTA